ncbi:MAG: hypothetical protein ICV85_21195 [Tolypothrix sp. T3-bin4]|nr:hypothetical protein [Tolypothrix sp. T3-bin4]
MRPQYNDRQSTLSTDSTPSNNLPQEKNPAIATITITVIKVPELTEQSSRDKERSRELDEASPSSPQSILSFLPTVLLM